MDFNDISSRLTRTLKSINASFDDDIAIFSTITEKEDSRSIAHTFEKIDKETIINQIFIILYNISSLKDNLKKTLEKKGVNPSIVEERINNSIHLQVLIDIINQEKHGYPLTKSNRSGKNPLIRDYRQVMSIFSGPEPDSGVSYIMNLDGSATIQKMDGGGEIKHRIIAKIYDGENNYLFELDELVNVSFQEFKAIADENNCF